MDPGCAQKKGTERVTDTVIVALVSTSGTLLVAVTALLLNYRGFVSLERRMERGEDDMKQLTGAINELDKRVMRVEIKLGIAPE
jgi:hypothetical protein